MDIESLMKDVASALPETSRRGRRTIREVCLSFDQDSWRVLAGGHPAVHIGEWGGDFDGDGATPEEALADCLKAIKSHS